MSRITDNIDWALQYASSKRFNDSMTSEETRIVYLRYLRQYHEALSKSPNELIGLKTSGMQNIATDLEFGAENLLDDYLYNNEELKIKPTYSEFQISNTLQPFNGFGETPLLP